MKGTKQSPGIIPLTLQFILDKKRQILENDIATQIKLSYIEIYNENILDLLNP